MLQWTLSEVYKENLGIQHLSIEMKVASIRIIFF